MLSDVFSELLGEACKKKHGELRNVRTALAQGRHLDRKDVQPIEEVRAERTCLNRFLQVSIRGGNHTNVHVYGFVASHRFKFPLLKNSQEFDLRCQRQLADFIEKNRAAVGKLKAPDVPIQSASKRSLDVTKKFALHQDQPR